MDKKKRKLLFVWTYTNWGGAQIYFLAIIKLALETWDVLVILPKNSSREFLSFLDELGVKYEFLEHSIDLQPAPGLFKKIRRQFRRIRSELEVFSYLKRFDLSDSILHIELGPWQSWLLLVALGLRKANIFVTLHNFRPGVSKLRALIWKTRMSIVSRIPNFGIFASNIDTKDQLKEWLPLSFWQERVKVTYTCVDPVQIERVNRSKIDVGRVRSSFGLPPDRYIVLAVGQFVDRKGRWIFLETARELAKERSDVAFVWLMPSKITVEDQPRVDSYGLDGVFFPVLSEDVGHGREAVLSFFRVGDIFALPSYIEGLPIALLEAMALGLPTVATEIYAIPEAVIHENTGLLVQAGDSAELAAAISRLLDEPDLRTRLSQTGQAFVLENFDEREAAAISIAEYDKCFASKG